MSTTHRYKTMASAVVAFLLLLALAGCRNDDPTVPVVPVVLSAGLTLVPEPEFSPGTTNTITWSVQEAGVSALPTGWSYLAQSSTDAMFNTGVDESPWLSEDNHTFANLADGATVYYRVKARNAQATESDWSLPVSSTQDAQAPIADITSLPSDQTSLLFNIDVTATDTGSGISQVELWYRQNGGDLVLYGLVTPGTVSFQTDTGGPHEFIALATDLAGNAQAMPTAPQATTLVPDPIILVDRDGFSWDITNAVLKHRIAEQWWDFGLGRFTIRPIINPRMINPGETGYPRPSDNTDIVAVSFNGDTRAYKIPDLNAREAVNDVVDGVPIAATY